MFDAQAQDQSHRPLKAVPLAHLARQGRWSLDAPRSYLVPVLMWFTAGQGRLSINDEMRGFTANNAIFLPATSRHAFEVCGRTQGTALFLGTDDLPMPGQMLHLRLTQLAEQIELNDLIEGFRRDAASAAPLAEQMLHHRAALIALWLSRKAIEGRSHPAADPQTAALAGPRG